MTDMKDAEYQNCINRARYEYYWCLYNRNVLYKPGKKNLLNKDQKEAQIYTCRDARFRYYFDCYGRYSVREAKMLKNT